MYFACKLASLFILGLSNTSAFDYSNRRVIWNPRFTNPLTDPDFNDFDKSGWNVVAGGSGEYIHHKIALLVVFNDTGRVDLNFNSITFVSGLSENYYNTSDFVTDAAYSGSMCVQNQGLLTGISILQPDLPLMPNCEQSFFFSTVWTATNFGHSYISGVFFSQPFNNDPANERPILISPRHFGDWRAPLLDHMTFRIPPVKALGNEYKPDRIMLASPAPSSVEANEPFTLQLKMVNATGHTITSSFNSGLEIMCQVAYTHKWFERVGGLWLAQTDAVLKGADVVTSVINDKVIFARFQNGLANITMQIEDVFENLELNCTSKWPLANYRRFPDKEIHPYKAGGILVDYDVFNTYGGYLTHPSSNETHIKYQHFENQPNFFRGVLIVPINVTAQAGKSLHIILPSQWKATQFVNRKFKGPLKVEILDANGRRVTSGPDSMLKVHPKANSHLVKFSSDAVITLNRGYAEWQGSVTSPASNPIQIHFEALTNASLAIQTVNAPQFVVTTDVYPIINYNGQQIEGDTLEAIKYYLQYDNTGPLNDKALFQLKMHINTMDQLYANLKAEEDQIATFQTDFKVTNYLLMLGPSNDALLDGFVELSLGEDYPLVNYRSTDSKYSDKTRFPNFVRMRYSDGYQYSMICNFLKSRKWDNVVLVETVDQGIPMDFVTCARIFQIKYSMVAFPPVADNTTVISDEAIDNFFTQLKEINIKTIVNSATGAALNYIVAEATRRNLSHANGYQWIGTLGMNDHFPYNNEGMCNGVQGPTNLTCMETFRGTIMFKPNYATYGFDNGYWSAYKGLLQMAQEVIYSSNPSQKPPLPTDEEGLLQIGLLYDATYATITSLAGIIDDSMTWSTRNFIDRFMQVDHPVPLTGDSVIFDKNYDRSNYSAVLMQIDYSENMTIVGKESLIAKRYLYLGDDVAPYNISKDNVLKEVQITGQDMFYIPSPDSALISVTIKSCKSTMNLKHQTSEAMQDVNMTIRVPPAFFCTGGCGGMVSPDNHHMWENGKCIQQDTCSCKIDPFTNQQVYTGANCEVPSCPGCIFGDCVAPGNCTCHEAYINTDNTTNDCATPTCLKFGCHATNGECTGGDFCKCKPNYYGKDCSQKCDCVTGKCSDGNSGSGLCTCESSHTGSRCQTHIAVIAVPTTFVAMAILAVLFYIGRLYYKKIELNAQLMSTDWMVEWDTIMMRTAKDKSSAKTLSMISVVSMMSVKSDSEKVETTVFHNQGRWNGKDIVVKLIRKENIELDSRLRWEVKEMRDIKHPNLCLFIGACINTDHVAILNELCGKGSLEDILSNDDIDLGWDFRYSMLKDICRGMMYLQNTAIGSHGRLKSSNCLVDSRWTIKLSDYGMKSFKSGQEGVRVFAPENGIGVSLPKLDEMDECDYYSLLWTAPEIAASGVSHPDHVGYGSRAGDMYSFAIVMVQMCTRNPPFHEIDQLEPSEIVQIIGRLVKPPKTVNLVQCSDQENVTMDCLRPAIEEDELPNEEVQASLMMELIEMCWNEDPKSRPEFKYCLSELGKICPHRGELMDNLIELMEQYTTSLESIVAERTADIIVEKEKGDLLLGKMLPPLIAEELKLGKNPQPEYFASVTIYFSDCVGFGQICSNASPYQVVELLNDLYSIMDDIIESFDCYKVETIGDCYVVASGLPTRNGDDHAGEIASMALALMTTIDGVGYKNMPGSQVQLRMGLNTGPIVAGVVGLKMPRYCLFGDTMNTASRMESGGYALKIHMSESTYTVLKNLGGYQSICRGEREVKGKGRMTTYWLTGKDNSEYRIPSEDLAISASKHNFK
ncbi:uncharacterized protein [Clytia hemisphaerica]|uniref:uncharacterized protein n=1 Tax=Clytia hemisphaerica TaxID=252671 RepID=UPI0034D4BA39